MEGELVMARRKRTNTEHGFVYERWKMFGEWITHQRLLVGFTQNQAAKVVGVSRRQWIRYELGAKVPVKRMELMSQVLHVSPDKMVDRAGYETSFKRHAAREQLGRIHDLICAGRLEFGMLQLLRLNDRITGIVSANGPRFGGLDATDYANAGILLNRLPDPYVKSLQKLMAKRVGDKEEPDEDYIKLRKRLRKKAAKRSC